MAQAKDTVRIHYFKRLREAANVDSGRRLYGIPYANIGDHYFGAMSLNLSLIRDRRHVRHVNLVSRRFSELERLVIRMSEFKRDRLTGRYTGVQDHMEKTC